MNLVKSLKSELLVDQKNIRAGTVVSVAAGVAKVRLSSGAVIRADGGDDYSTGDKVMIQGDGQAWSISGTAPLANLDGEIIKHV